MSLSGAIFDVDGVLVDTPHERSWRDALQELLEGPWSDLLAAAHPDLVVTTLDDVDLEALRDGRLAKR